MLGGWLILNTRNETTVQTIPVFRKTLGLLQSFGNLRVPHDSGRLGDISWVGDLHALGVLRDELGVERVVRLVWN